MTETMRLRARADASLDAARSALTDPAALRVWLADNVEVDLPDRFAFWGPGTPGIEPRQRFLSADDRSLRFAWTVGGVETTVELAVSPGADGTVVSVTHGGVPNWADAVADESSDLAILTTFWGLAIANLVEYLEGREPTPRPDYTSAEQRAEVTIGADPAAVYDSLMNPEVFRRWFGANLGVEPRVGGRWAMGGFDFPDHAARILELEPARRVSMEWPDGMVSTWELAGSEGRTRLTFVQSGFDAPPHTGWTGWLAGMVELRRYHEVPGWRPLWIFHDLPGVPDDMTVVGTG
ncbi:SRPBCC family protein [Actinophytocola gossypii]|nr:SRPBCC family protein [Actinophytocola gossypii]